MGETLQAYYMFLIFKGSFHTLIFSALLTFKNILFLIQNTVEKCQVVCTKDAVALLCTQDGKRRTELIKALVYNVSISFSYSLKK